MANDTFYFSHDYSARNDEKIKRLIRKYKYLGYGIYWAIIEDLYNNANALRTDYDGIAFDLHTDEKTIKSIVEDFDLFVFDGEFFGSLSVQKRLNKRQEKSNKASENANKRWNKTDSNANALQTHCDGNAIKERKGKENKVKDIKIKDIKLENIYIPENEFSVNEKFDNLFYSQITKIWFDFYLDNFSLKPSFGAMEGKKLKSIANKIKNISIQMNLELNQDLMEKSFLKFLNLAFSDNWLKSNFQLSILDSKFDSIIQKENYGKSATTKIVKSSFGD
jgi:hypothetical protein